MVGAWQSGACHGRKLKLTSTYYRHNFINMMMQLNLFHIDHVLAVYSCRMNDVHVIYLILEKRE